MQTTIHRGYSYPLHPSPEQEERLLQYTAACRFVWNLALEQRFAWRNLFRQYPDLYGNTYKRPGFASQSRELTEALRESEFLQSVPRDMLDRTLRALDRAYPTAAQRAKGKGYPRWKCKDRDESFTVRGKHIQIRKLNDRWGIVKLPKMEKWVKFRCDRQLPDDATFTEAAIHLAPFGWRVSIAWKAEREMAFPDGEVGIDRGIAVPVMLSDGRPYHMPKGVDRLDAVIKRAQRTVSRRTKGSNRRKRAVRRLARLKARQANIRKEWAHRITTKITSRYGRVVAEKLQTRNMTGSAKGTMEKPGKNVAAKSGLNREILKVGWASIAAMLAYKAGDYQEIDPAYTSQTCSRCGATDRENRKSQAKFHCHSCGFQVNADCNAARVILRRGCAPSLRVEGKGNSLPMKRESQPVQRAAI